MEQAVYNLLDVLKGSYDEHKLSLAPSQEAVFAGDRCLMRDKAHHHRKHELEEEAEELVTHFNNKFVDSLLRCIRNTLDCIKRKVFPA